MKSYEGENRRRGLVLGISSVIFVVAATIVLLCGIVMVSMVSLKNSAEDTKENGYYVYYYGGIQVTPTEFYLRLNEYNENEASQDSSFDGAFDGTQAQVVRPDGSKPEGEIVDYISEGFYIERIMPNFGFDDELYHRYMGILWIVEIVSLLLVPTSLILAFLYCGQRREDGSIKLMWLDRIFPEIRIAAAASVSLGVIIIYTLMLAWLYGSEIIKGYVSELFQRFADIDSMLPWISVDYYGRGFANLFQPSWVLLLLSIVLSILMFAFDLLMLVSIAKTIKARSFWRSTVIGSIVYRIKRSLPKSTRRMEIIVPMLILLVALLFFANVFMNELFGNPYPGLIASAILLTVGILIVAPQKIKKYNMVKAGLDEVGKGNFEYKIPDLGKGEFGDLAKSINSITEAQNEAIRSEIKSQRLRSELISNVSHDLRTPLTSMISYVDLLRSEGLDSPNAEKYLDIISEKTERLHKFTDDLFEAAKASSGDIPINITRIDMDQMVRQAIAELSENLDENSIETVYSCKAENTLVEADGNLLWRVIENLITNVGKYALPGSRAYIDLTEDEGNVLLEVKNVSRDALNISAAELLERFQRGDDSRNTEGSGLGLAIANDLTALMKGEFNIYVDGDLFKASVKLKKAR